MTPADYEYITKFLKDRSGLILSADKQYLVESRLQPVARKLNLESISDLIAKLPVPTERALQEAVVEAMTTNESFFFRDKTPFDRFNDTMLPELIKSRATQRKLRIWCAAASTGQEPYSIAICLKEAGTKIPGWRTEIVGTDLSKDVLEKAKVGLYSQFEVQRGLPIQLLLKYFAQQGDLWQVSPELRSMVQWRSFNLLDSFTGLGAFDIVFCRNVLIYFDQKTKVDILGRIAKQLSPDGFLVLGAAETVIGLTDSFVPVPDKRGLYQPAQKDGSLAPKPLGIQSATSASATLPIRKVG